MKNAKCLATILLSGAVAISRTSVLADSAADIQTYPNNAAATYDDNGSGNYPIVTAILSAPSTSAYNPTTSLDGYTYSSWAYFAADTTGSLDIFYSSTVVGPKNNYPLPTVGDTILAQGNYSVFDGIPELANSAANPLTVSGPGTTGNAPYNATPALTSISTVNVGTNAFGLNSSGLAGTLIQLNNVTISGATTFAYHANTTATITDQSANSMTFFLWASSYSNDGMIATAGGTTTNGVAVPTGLVDMTGFVDDFGNSAEFVPISITAVPEPSALNLCGLGSALAWVGYRLRRKA